MWVALGERMADTTSIQTGVFTHACAPVVHRVQDTRTVVRTRGVAASHVAATGCSQLTFIHILTDKAITLVSIQAVADVGPVCVATQGLGTAVVRQGGVLLTLVHILAVKAIALHARWTGTVERSRCVCAAGNWMASSILDLALIKVYNLSKMGQCQANSPKWC